MQVHANGTPFFQGITFPVDIKRAKCEKPIFAGQIRYAIRIIDMHEKITYLGSTVKYVFNPFYTGIHSADTP